MRVLIVDYGIGNLASVRRAFEECGTSAWISDRPDELREASHIVLPGVGAFSDGMRELDARGWSAALREAAIDDEIPLLGICLGMQLLADIGEEGGATAGLGLIPGRVVRLKPAKTKERVPHVGWNEVHPRRPLPLFEGISNGADFYFVHSYHFLAQNQNDVAADTPYCGRFHSAVQRGNIVGVQFHPEKSSRNGMRLIRNFLTFGMSRHA